MILNTQKSGPEEDEANYLIFKEREPQAKADRRIAMRKISSNLLIEHYGEVTTPEWCKDPRGIAPQHRPAGIYSIID